uniref:Plant heme peroxidase family profile domain-containing protein n=1 Tax=Oryza brachyantha TaxID=4533 RepID=J3KZD4_ORYBR
MASSNWLALAMAVAVAVASTLPAASRAQLQVGFYNTSCPRAEALVRQAVAAAVANTSGLAAGLIRLHFHDCFVRASGTISPAYQALLEALCAGNTEQSSNVTTAIDLSTPATLDNNYYKLLPLNLGLFFSDDQLIRNATLLPFVNAFTANETLWKEKFAAAMIKMGNIDVLTGTQGEIRLNCSAVNAPSSSASAGTMIIDTVFPDADGGEVAAS